MQIKVPPCAWGLPSCDFPWCSDHIYCVQETDEPQRPRGGHPYGGELPRQAQHVDQTRLHHAAASNGVEKRHRGCSGASQGINVRNARSYILLYLVLRYCTIFDQNCGCLCTTVHHLFRFSRFSQHVYRDHPGSSAFCIVDCSSHAQTGAQPLRSVPHSSAILRRSRAPLKGSL